MTIQDLGSIGELLAAVATIATLVYLARQLRANTTAVQGESRRAHRGTVNATNLLIASDPAIAGLLNAGLRDFGALSPEQHTQFTFLMAELIGSWEIAHREFESGIVDEENVQRATLACIPLLQTPGGRKWWDTYGNRYPPAFQAYLSTQFSTPSHQGR